MTQIDKIYAVWPSAAALAREIGVSEVTVRQWRNRSARIPVQYWRKIAAAAILRGVSVPLDWFLDDPAPLEAIARADSVLSAKA